MFVFIYEDRLVCHVVKMSAWGAEDPVFECRFQWDFSGSSQTSDLKIGIPVATLRGDWLHKITASTGWPCISTLWLGEVESLSQCGNT